MLPLEEVHRQGLGHRAVIVLLYDARGRLYLRKRGPGRRLFPGRWDVSAAGHVRVGESREEAAHRHLERDLGVRASRLTLRMAVPASTATGNEFVTLYAAVRVREVPASAASEDGMFVDRDELAYLAEQCRDLLTPALVHCWETGLVFPPSSLP
ncbi:MAG: NUDIX domain-containing protein [Desulfovibrionaceae bacterium]|nr:NUDIX domain-containing protein [Desulfovibrionaceae bacterium]